MGNGQFETLDYVKTGFLVEGDAKALVELPLTTGENLILVTQNQDSTRIFIRKQEARNVLIDDEDAWAEIFFDDGSVRKQEFYFGNTYLSQTARVLQLPDNAETYKIYNYNNSVIKSQ